MRVGFEIHVYLTPEQHHTTRWMATYSSAHLEVELRSETPRGLVDESACRRKRLEQRISVWCYDFDWSTAWFQSRTIYSSCSLGWEYRTVDGIPRSVDVLCRGRRHSSAIYEVQLVLITRSLMIDCQVCVALWQVYGAVFPTEFSVLLTRVYVLTPNCVCSTAR